MRFQMTEISIIDVIKVASFQVGTVVLAFTLADLKEILGVISIFIAIGYGIWKWRTDVKDRKNKNKSE